jgi:hypothetical protein
MVQATIQLMPTIRLSRKSSLADYESISASAQPKDPTNRECSTEQCPSRCLARVL